MLNHYGKFRFIECHSLVYIALIASAVLTNIIALGETQNIDLFINIFYISSFLYFFKLELQDLRQKKNLKTNDENIIFYCFIFNK